jgi:hypothetical protein
MGGYLATIQDEVENEFLQELADFMDQIWLGATDVEEEGTWAWVTGEPWDYANWEAGQGPDFGENPDYLILNKDSGWSAIDATEVYLSGKTPRLYYVCEWDPEPATPEPVPTSTTDTRIFNPENKHFYFYSWGSSNVTPKVWPSAQEYCERQGGYLVSIQDAAENEFIHELLGDLPPTWLGATDEEEEGTWVWASGEPWQYTNWEQGEPSGEEGEHYLTIDYGNGRWSDRESSFAEPLEFICEWDAEPVTPEPTSTQDQRILNPANQHLYRFFGDPTTPSGTNWRSARDYCEALGGYLVTIQDAVENEFVWELSGGQSWLGATDEEQEGIWVWVSGEPWDYTNWGSGYPSDANGEDYLIHKFGPEWSDATLASQADFVCEWDPEPDWDWGVSAGGTFAPIFEYIGGKSPTFEDDFSTSKSEWGVTSVGTSITSLRQDETLLVTNPGSDVAFPVNGLFKATNFVMSFDFFPNKEESTGVLEVAFRASQNLDIYYKFKFSFSDLGLRDAWLFSQNDGTMTRTTDNGGVSLMNDYNQILFILHEEMLGVYVNEELVFEKTDLERWSDENFMIYPAREGGSVSFDNFAFWDLDEVEFDG